MSFINRLILNKQGRLPLVKPRLPGRFENTTPGAPEPGEVSDDARTFARPVVRDSRAKEEKPPEKEIKPIRKPGPAMTAEGLFSTRKRKPDSSDADANDLQEETKSPDQRDREEMRDSRDDETEGILVERHYLAETGEPPSGYPVKYDNPTSATTPVRGRKSPRQPGGPSEQSVTVHIGSVEVRAIVEQKEKPRKKSTNRKPDMSLQEYLDKKNNRS